jgi:hypothetical protein
LTLLGPRGWPEGAKSVYADTLSMLPDAVRVDEALRAAINRRTKSVG